MLPRPAPSVDDAPWLSILIPVYNVEAYLRECVESVLRQCQADAGIEILLLDDASSDRSPSLLRELQGECPRLRLLSHPANQGLAASRNTLLETAGGRYIWFLDADDKLLPDAVRQLKAIVTEHEPDIVLCDFQVWRAVTRLKHRLRRERHRTTFKGPSRRLLGRQPLIEGLLATGQMHSWSKIAKRELYGNRVRFPVGHYYEDVATSIALACQARTAWHQPEAWVAYRQRPESILATLSVKKLVDLTRSWSSLQSCRDAQQGIDDEVAAFLTRSYIATARRIEREAASPLEQQLTFRQLNAAYHRALPCSIGEVQRLLLRRLWLWRLVRLKYWLAKTGFSASA